LLELDTDINGKKKKHDVRLLELVN